MNLVNSGRMDMPSLGEGSAIIADDHELFRAAMVELFKRAFNFKEILEAASLDEALDLLGRVPSVTFAALDLAMPGMNGTQSLAGIREVFPEVRIAVVTASERREDILSALGAGVHGFIPKTLGIQEASNAFRLILSGHIFVPAALATPPPKLSSEDIPPPISDAVAKFAGLSPRQKDVLTLLSQGLSNKEIARSLELAEGTVKVHVNALFRALGAHNRVSVVAALARLEAQKVE